MLFRSGASGGGSGRLAAGGEREDGEAGRQEDHATGPPDVHAQGGGLVVAEGEQVQLGGGGDQHRDGHPGVGQTPAEYRRRFRAGAPIMLG